MLSTENNLNYNLQRRNILGGKVTSIWNENSIFVGARSHPILDFTYLTSNFSDFEKNVYEQEQKMIYHLSGYGTSFNEALVSYIGESSERYTFASFYNIIKYYIITKSYNEMCVEFGEDNVCPLELINSSYALRCEGQSSSRFSTVPLWEIKAEKSNMNSLLLLLQEILHMECEKVMTVSP